MAKVLLDTNIAIHREANRVRNESIGVLFRWLDRLGHQKCIHRDTLSEISRHADGEVRKSFEAKLQSYALLQTTPPDHPNILQVRAADRTDNDRVDTNLLNEIAQGRVDILITEDRGIHKKAVAIGLDALVFTIDSYLEKVTAENPELADYAVLSVKRELFGNINLSDPFFDSFRADYREFDKWFNKKSDEIAYVCRSETGSVIGFLYLKKEDEREPYSEINPVFSKASRLKIGTFKVIANGFKLGERFLKVIFDNASILNVSEIYVTLFEKSGDQVRLRNLLTEWGFEFHGVKRTDNGEEVVLVRKLSAIRETESPKLVYPFVKRNSRKFIVPIYPSYHTELLPDSVLRTESPMDFVESKPNRNAISKVYISRSINRDLRQGDLIVFYRTASGGAAHYTSVATTIGVVDSVVHNIASLEQFIKVCRKRSVFSDAELATHWNYSPNRPFVVNFLYLLTFPKRLNLKDLREQRIITNAPRGFEPITDVQFETLCRLSRAEIHYLVDQA